MGTIRSSSANTFLTSIRRGTEFIQVCQSSVVKLNSLLPKGFYDKKKKKKSVCYIFLGDPTDTVEEAVKSLHIYCGTLNFTGQIFCTLWIHKEQQLLDAESLPARKPQCRWVRSLFLCLSAAKNWLWTQSLFTGLYPGICH